MNKSDLKALLRYAIKNNLMHKPLSYVVKHYQMQYYI
jgi:hypothetical protein